MDKKDASRMSPTTHVVLPQCPEDVAVKLGWKHQCLHHVFSHNICCSLLAWSHVRVALATIASSLYAPLGVHVRATWMQLWAMRLQGMFWLQTQC